MPRPKRAAPSSALQPAAFSLLRHRLARPHFEGTREEWVAQRDALVLSTADERTRKAMVVCPYCSWPNAHAVSAQTECKPSRRLCAGPVRSQFVERRAGGVVPRRGWVPYECPGYTLVVLPPEAQERAR